MARIVKLLAEYCRCAGYSRDFRAADRARIYA